MRKTLAVWILLGLAGCAEISFRPVDLNSPARPGRAATSARSRCTRKRRRPPTAAVLAPSRASAYNAVHATAHHPHHPRRGRPGPRRAVLPRWPRPVHGRHRGPGVRTRRRGLLRPRPRPAPGPVAARQPAHDSGLAAAPQRHRFLPGPQRRHPRGSGRYWARRSGPAAPSSRRPATPSGAAMPAISRTRTATCGKLRSIRNCFRSEIWTCAAACGENRGMPSSAPPCCWPPLPCRQPGRNRPPPSPPSPATMPAST